MCQAEKCHGGRNWTRALLRFFLFSVRDILPGFFILVSFGFLSAWYLNGDPGKWWRGQFCVISAKIESRTRSVNPVNVISHIQIEIQLQIQIQMQLAQRLNRVPGRWTCSMSSLHKGRRLCFTRRAFFATATWGGFIFLIPIFSIIIGITIFRRFHQT